MQTNVALLKLSTGLEGVLTLQVRVPHHWHRCGVLGVDVAVPDNKAEGFWGGFGGDTTDIGSSGFLGAPEVEEGVGPIGPNISSSNCPGDRIQSPVLPSNKFPIAGVVVNETRKCLKVGRTPTQYVIDTTRTVSNATGPVYQIVNDLLSYFFWERKKKSVFELLRSRPIRRCAPGVDWLLRRLSNIESRTVDTKCCPQHSTSTARGSAGRAKLRD